MCPRDGPGRGSGSGAEATPTRRSGEWNSAPSRLRDESTIFMPTTLWSNGARGVWCFSAIDQHGAALLLRREVSGPKRTVESMRNIRTLPRTASAGLIAAGCAASLLVGCSSDDGAGESTETTVTDTITQQPASTPSQPESATGRAPTPDGGAGDGSCADAAVTNPLVGEQPIPVHFANVDDSDVSFYYTATEGQPDPCTPLSWVKLAGTNGAGGPGATAGSDRETVALFGDGRLITDPAPILARQIESIEQVDDRTVRVNYAFYTEAPAVLNETDAGSATFHWDGDRLEVTENTLPASQNDTAETLDMSGVM